MRDGCNWVTAKTAVPSKRGQAHTETSQARVFPPPAGQPEPPRRSARGVDEQRERRGCSIGEQLHDVRTLVAGEFDGVDGSWNLPVLTIAFGAYVARQGWRCGYEPCTPATSDSWFRGDCCHAWRPGRNSTLRCGDADVRGSQAVPDQQ